VTGLALVVGQGIAAAQAPAVSSPQPPPDAVVGLQRQVSLSPKEQLAQSDAAVSRMDSARSVVRRQLESARAQRDVVKTLCLNDKLNQLDVALRSARERRAALEGAVQRSDVDLSTHEFTIMSVLRLRAETLSAEANQCIGQEAQYFGNSAVTTTVESTIPDETQPVDTGVTSVVVQVPPCASCVK
jgi:hypothetical protein